MQVSPFAGAGSELRGVRPWVEGDPVRSVDWRVTARRDALHVRSWQEERDLPVILLLDCTPGLFAVRDGWYGRVLSRAARWTLTVAEAAGHPVGAAAFGGPPARWAPPVAGRSGSEAVRRILAAASLDAVPSSGGAPGRVDRRLASAGLAGAVEVVTTHHRAEALLVLLSAFDLGPDAVAPTERALAAATRRHRLVAVWADGESQGPAPGVQAVRTAGGDHRLLDGGSAGIRGQLVEGREAWRTAVGRMLAGRAHPVVRLEPDEDPPVTLARAFRRDRRSAGGRPPGRTTARRSRTGGRVARSAALCALMATAIPVGSGPLAAQQPTAFALLPGEAEVVSDSFAAPPMLGTGVLRHLRVRTGPGARLAPPQPRSGNPWDVVSSRVRPVSGDTLWEVTQEVLPWRVGRLPPPAARILLADAAGVSHVRLEPPGASRDVRVGRPPRPAGQVRAPGVPAGGPTWPRVHPMPRAWLWRALGWLPPLLSAAALLQLAGPLLRRLGASGRRLPPARVPGMPELEALPPREALDRIVQAARGLVRERAGVNPAGWTPPRWEGWARNVAQGGPPDSGLATDATPAGGVPASDPGMAAPAVTAVELAPMVVRIVGRADEVRFDPTADHRAAVREVGPRLSQLPGGMVRVGEGR